MALSSNFTVTLKNNMLQQLRDSSQLILQANQGSIFAASGAVTFNAPSNGRMELTSNVTLTIPEEGAPWDINQITLRTGGIGGTVLLQFTPPSPISFPNGGSLIITQLDVEIDD